MKQLQRTFYPGDKWIYFKIYTGIKTADKILINSLYPIEAKLMKDKKIDKCFFIRYTDPDFHIRFRLLIKDCQDIGYIIELIHKKLKKDANDSFISKIEISTYCREIERYKSQFMELSESIFWLDSKCIFSLLANLVGKDEDYRWMLSLYLINSFLTSIGYNLNEKADCMGKMSESYKVEFGYNEHNCKQLNLIYRNRREEINLMLNDKEKNEGIQKSIAVVDRYSLEIKKLTKDIQLPEENIFSYIHMSMNRLFRYQNRICELLIYDFLHRYYKSEIAKLKIRNG